MVQRAEFRGEAAILGKFSSQAIAEAEAAVRVDLVHLLRAPSFDGYACAAHYDA